MVSVLRHRASLILASGVSLIVFALFSGCSSAQEDSDPYATQFAEAASSAQSDFVRQILADGRVETSELFDAQQKVTQCMSDAGFHITYVQDDYGQWNISYEMSIQDSAESTRSLERQLGSCQLEWMGPIDQLYWQIYTNPRNEDWNSLVAACLVRKGLAPEGFTGQDYADLLSTWAVTGDTSTMTPDDDGVIRFENPELGPVPTLPGGASFEQEDVWKCTVLPLQ